MVQTMLQTFRCEDALAVSVLAFLKTADISIIAGEAQMVGITSRMDQF